jgi:hypothetical protein
METDKPISLLTEDKLHRKNFVTALANEITKLNDKDCSVIGLYGKWGSGKTSIIRLLDEELKLKWYFTSYFNPWRYKSEDVLLKELFLKILEGAQSDKKLESNIQELGNLFDEYSQYISIPKVSFWGIAFDFTSSFRGFGKGFGKLLKGNTSYDAKKIKINNVLRNLALPLIIFIDDVDRLDVNEIQSLFKTIKLTADFNNLIYVVAFDEEIVSKALAKNYGTGEIADGKNFLEKIVQLPLRIPYVNEQEKFEYTIGLFNEWLNKDNIALPDKYQNLFVKHFRDLHDDFIKTPRDSKRLLSSVSFSYHCLKDEVNIYDIFLLETIRIFSPLVFDELISHKKDLFSLSKRQDGHAIRNELDELGKKFKEKISQYINAMPAIQGTIDFLFPANKLFNIGWDTYQSEKQEDLFKHQRVGIQKYFDRFIEFKIGNQDISDTEFKALLEKINNNGFDSLKTQIERLCSFQKQSIYVLFVHFKGQLTPVGKINVIKILCTIEHFFKDTSPEGRMFNRPIWFSFELLSQIEIDCKVDTLKFVVLHCEKIHYASLIILEADRGYGSKKEMKFEPQNALDDIAKIFIQAVQQLPTEKFFENVDEEKNYILFKQIEKYGDEALLKLKVKEFISNKTENALFVMKSLIGMVYINFSERGTYPTDIRSDTFIEIEQYIERETLRNISYSLFPDLKNDNTTDEQIELREVPIDKMIIAQYLKFISKNSIQ